jgi:transcriptional regulator with XRE-family HTH domain
MENDVFSEILEKRRARKRLPDPEMCVLVRKRAGFTQRDVALVLRVDPATVSRWESGDRNPRPSQLAGYLRLLDRLAREATR